MGKWVLWSHYVSILSILRCVGGTARRDRALLGPSDPSQAPSAGQSRHSGGRPPWHQISTPTCRCSYLRNRAGSPVVVDVPGDIVSVHGTEVVGQCGVLHRDAKLGGGELELMNSIRGSMLVNWSEALKNCLSQPCGRGMAQSLVIPGRARPRQSPPLINSHEGPSHSP